MVAKAALHALNSGFVLDRSVFVTTDAAAMTDLISHLRADQVAPLIVVEDATTFFTPDTLIDFIAHKDARASLINEKIGFFTEDQMAALLGGNAGNVEDGGGGLIVGLEGELPGYKFAQVPAGWSVNDNMSLGPTRIKRKINSPEGDGTLFYMSPNEYEKLWEFAAHLWSGADGPLTAYFLTGQGKIKATVEDTCIKIGGNYIRRYEIEQVAKYRNWNVPQLQAA